MICNQFEPIHYIVRETNMWILYSINMSNVSRKPCLATETVSIWIQWTYLSGNTIHPRMDRIKILTKERPCGSFQLQEDLSARFSWYGVFLTIDLRTVRRISSISNCNVHVWQKVKGHQLYKFKLCKQQKEINLIQYSTDFLQFFFTFKKHIYWVICSRARMLI